MPITQLNPAEGSGNLATAIGLWNQFFGPQSKQNAANLANTQAQTPGIKAASTSAQVGAQDAQQSQMARDTAATQFDSLNNSFDQPLTAQNPGFWHMLSDDQRNQVTSGFGNQGVKPAYVPQAWNAHVAERFNVAPPMMLPYGSSIGGSTEDDVNGVRRAMVPEFHDGKLSFISKDYPMGLTPDQITAVKKDPVGGVAALPGAQQEAGKAYSSALTKNLQDYQDRVGKTPALTTYFGNGGEQQGVLPLWRDVDAFRQKHSDQSGNWTGDLTPQEATTLVYRLGRVDNPGAIVRDSAFEQIAKNAGVYDSIVASVEHAAAGKSKIPAAVVKDIYNVVDQLKGSAELRAHDAMRSWEPELAQHGLDLSDVIHDNRALAEFNAKYGPYAPNVQAAAQSLRPGERFHSPDTPPGKVGVVTPAQGATPPQAAPGPKQPGTLPNLNGMQAAVQGPPAPPASAAAPTTPNLPPVQPSLVQPPPTAAPRHEDFGSYRDWAKAEDAYEASQTAPAKAAYSLFKRYVPADDQTRAVVGVGGLPKVSTSAFLGLGNPDSMNPVELRNWVFSQMKSYGKNPPDWLLKLNNEIVRQSALPNVRPSGIRPPGAQ